MKVLSCGTNLLFLHSVSGCRECFYGALEIGCLDEDVVGVKRRDGAYGDPRCGQRCGKRRENSGKGEVERADDLERGPSGVDLQCIGWCLFANDGKLVVGSSYGEETGAGLRSGGLGRQPANGKLRI